MQTWERDVKYSRRWRRGRLYPLHRSSDRRNQGERRRKASTGTYNGEKDELDVHSARPGAQRLTVLALVLRAFRRAAEVYDHEAAVSTARRNVNTGGSSNDLLDPR